MVALLGIGKIDPSEMTSVQRALVFYVTRTDRTVRSNLGLARCLAEVGELRSCLLDLLLGLFCGTPGVLVTST